MKRAAIDIPRVGPAIAPGLECRGCGARTQVLESRRSTWLYGVRRRRKCGACGARFSTVELPSSDLDELNRRLGDLERAMALAERGINGIRKVIKDEAAE